MNLQAMAWTAGKPPEAKEQHGTNPVRNERGLAEGERQPKHQHRVYCSGRSPVEGDPSKRARAHSHTQAWARYRGLVEKNQEGHEGIPLLGNQER
jgi:hypothetical protein